MRAAGPLPGLQPVLVIGPRDSGKTEYARAVVARARARGRTVAGLLSEAELEDGRKSRYYARDLAEPERRLLLGSASPVPGLDRRVGRFFMSTAVFTSLNETLMTAVAADLICLDEVGPLEKEGGGFAPALEFLVEHYSGILLVTARPSVAPWLAHRLQEAKHRRGAADRPRTARGYDPTEGVQGFPTPRGAAAG